jgi:hypothetical protein
MRLWSLHPQYLDVAGLVAVWREGLLAQKVLRGETRGYRHHPQLWRFRREADPLAAIATYLEPLWAEATRRGYRFARDKITAAPTSAPLTVTRGQLRYEWAHLLAKVQRRAPAWYTHLLGIPAPHPHPLFYVIEGEREAWERGPDNENAPDLGAGSALFPEEHG